MRFTLYLSTAVAVTVLWVSLYHINHTSAASPAVPLVPAGAIEHGPVARATSTPLSTPQLQDPTELSIPSIHLSVPVISVGLNSAGQMDVPSASSGAVGWYEYGTVPGATGSAVIDAHVFAAFNTLRYAKVGDDIYVTEGATQLHFKITSSMVYPTADVPAQQLFNEEGGKYLNLITCAGSYDAALGTYDHRLVDYAVLVND